MPKLIQQEVLWFDETMPYVKLFNNILSISPKTDPQILSYLYIRTGTSDDGMCRVP